MVPPARAVLPWALLSPVWEAEESSLLAAVEVRRVAESAARGPRLSRRRELHTNLVLQPRRLDRPQLLSFVGSSS